MYDSKEHTKYTLFSGTEVIQTRNRDSTIAIALVIRTSFDTAKGLLVKSILFPKPSKFRFYSDSMRFIAWMAILSVVGMAVSIPFQLKFQSAGTILLKSLDLITICIPPALPAAMTVGITIALSRLKKSQIYCISPPRMNVAGRVSIIVFDKTGTLTEEGLSVFAFRPTHKIEIKPSLVFESESRDISHVESSLKQQYLKCMATCHSISVIEGMMVGDPLDIKMFETTGFTLKENLNVTIVEQENRGYEIIKRFEFQSKLMRMSVVIRNASREETIFVKGSPEKILDLCVSSSIPSNF
jgi:cation-transporting P-type ATPase 13A2